MGHEVCGRAARWFATMVAGIHSFLPGVLARIPQTFIGFALINSLTFGVDLVLLGLTHRHLHLAYPLAVSISYGVACLLAFLLNRVLNFRSHGPIGTQSSKYLVVMVSNYLIWILLFSSVLEALGVHYQIARVTAACLEGLYVYLLARLWVFRTPKVPGGRPGASRSRLRPVDAGVRSPG